MRAARFLIAAPLTLLLAGLAACGDNDASDGFVGAPGASTPEAAADSDPTAVTCVTGGGGDTGIAITGFTFQPGEHTIDAGTTVTFTNEDPTDHSVWSADRVAGEPAWTSTGTDPMARLPELLHEGDSTTCTFPEAGTYAYLCGVHNSMTGTITVA